ncbi:hypothetical protein ILUMI_23511 [Ignelater luminosus]|uniref:Uncharacterized protein n=1 Tax=Ignelater luminosus TaxID=2038154 RepID=A0A8K0CCB3_IGNLU|nr:hypothetical protein ILUMI_23511 [Ignelater luminosus]
MDIFIHMIKILIALPLLIVLSGCIQTLYKFVPEHCEVTNINRSLVDMKLGKCYKLSRTELYLNISFSLRVNILNDHMGQVNSNEITIYIKFCFYT